MVNATTLVLGGNPQEMGYISIEELRKYVSGMFVADHLTVYKKGAIFCFISYEVMSPISRVFRTLAQAIRTNCSETID